MDPHIERDTFLGYIGSLVCVKFLSKPVHIFVEMPDAYLIPGTVFSNPRLQIIVVIDFIQLWPRSWNSLWPG